MKSINYEYIILGGGCAALSLAMNIKKIGIKDSSFLILESRKNYTDDRSWCFWEKDSNEYEDLIDASWKKWRFSKDKNLHTKELKNYSYHYIRSINFYRKALKIIKESNNICIKMNEEVKLINHKDDIVVIKTDKSIYTAKKVLDTIPRENVLNKKPLIFQSFLGYELILNQPQCFNEVAHIMSNMTGNNKEFIFDYILPISKRSILFETTFFSEKRRSKEIIRAELFKRINKYDLGKFKILREEYGVIPMGIFKKKENKKNYFLAGTLGGAIRASSGYGFLRIQDWAIKCSANLKKNNNFISHPKEKRIYHFMDKMLLKLLTKNILKSSIIFYYFFKRVPSRIFIRFMNSKTNLIENIVVMLCMPIKMFLIFLLKS